MRRVECNIEDYQSVEKNNRGSAGMIKEEMVVRLGSYGARRYSIKSV